MPRPIAAEVMRRFDAGEFDVAHLAYFELPLGPGAGAHDRPDHPGKAACSERHGTPAASAGVEYEPDEEAILAELLPATSRCKSIARCWRNQAGFYGSQMTAMDNATRNAGDTITGFPSSTTASARPRSRPSW
jgi:F-type H+-transporting ATPase subunit gamma